MTMLLRIAERVLNCPLLIHPDKVPLILSVLDGRIPLGDTSDLLRASFTSIADMPEAAQVVMLGPSPSASRFVGNTWEEDPQSGKKRPLSYSLTPDGVAVITVTGSLINRGAWVGSYSGATSYEGINKQVLDAAGNPRVHAILLDIESPGGEAVGAFESAAAIRKAAASKPVSAVVNGMAASAAYALASGANRIVTTPTGISGSIGVVMLHADFSRQLDKRGITPTLIFAGAHKVDANSLEPLTPAVRESLQAEVDRYYELFVKTVDAGREGLTPAAIRATEARTFIGSDAVKAGLADEVGTFEDALAELSRGARRANRGSKMRDERTYSQAELEAAVAEARTASITEGRTIGAEAERTRIAAILGHAEAGGRESLAQHYAFKTSVAPEEAAAALAAAPKAEPPLLGLERLAATAPAVVLGAPPSVTNADGNHGWSKHIAAINKRITGAA